MEKDHSPIIIKRLNSLRATVDRIETAMVTKEKFRQETGKMLTRKEFNTTMDEVLTIVRRLDQERVFTMEWVRRIEADVDRVKKHLHLV